MAVTQNLSRSLAGIGPGVVSVVAYLYPAPVQYTQTGAMPAGEVGPGAAQFVVFEGFTGKSGNGTSVGRGRIDTGAQTAMGYYNATSLDVLLIQVFGTTGG